jgi:hypothetical protein
VRNLTVRCLRNLPRMRCRTSKAGATLAKGLCRPLKMCDLGDGIGSLFFAAFTPQKNHLRLLLSPVIRLRLMTLTFEHLGPGRYGNRLTAVKAENSPISSWYRFVVHIVPRRVDLAVASGERTIHSAGGNVQPGCSR